MNSTALARDENYTSLMPWEKWGVARALYNVDGTTVACDRALREYFSRLQADNLVTNAFPEGDVLTEREFVELAYSDKSVMFVVLDLLQSHKDNPYIVAHLILTGFQGLCAQMHYSSSKELWGQSQECGTETIRQLFTLRRSPASRGGETAPLVETLVGLTPVSNKLAIRLLKKCGFRVVETLKNSYYRPLTNDFEDAVLSVITKEDLDYG